MLKRLRAALKKCIDLFINVSSKIDEKSCQKVRKTLFARKIDKKSLPGAPFGIKDRFWANFGVPEGTPKLGKRGDTPQEKWSWKLPGSHFERFNALLSILAPLLVNSGSILGHPGSDLEPFW